MKFSSVVTSLLAFVAVSSALPLAQDAINEFDAREIAMQDNEIQLRDNIDSEPVMVRDIEIEPYEARDLVEYDLEARKGGGGGIADVLEMAITGFINLAKGIKEDKRNRGVYTSQLVAELKKQNPAFNYVVCHTKHDYKWDGVRGKDWTHTHKEFDIKIGGTIGYEIYAAKSGTFTRKGDGGYLNWAYIGNVVKKSGDGKVLTFGKP